MGVVDDHAERLARIHALHSAGDSADAGQALPDRIGLELEGFADRDRGEGVVGIEPAGELERDGSRPARRDDLEPKAMSVFGDGFGADVGARIGAVGDEPRSCLACHRLEQAAVAVVAVDDPGPRRGLDRQPVGKPLEQAQLGGPVALERPVELEMLVAQVREDRDVIGDSRDPVEREPVRGGLEDRDVVAGLDHGPQGCLELRGLGRGHVLRIGVARAVDLHLHGPDEPGRPARRLEGGHDQGAGGALAVRAGDPDDRELVARAAVEPGSGVTERRAGRFHDELRHGDVRQGLLHDRCRGSRVGGRLHEVVAVGMLAGDGHEQRPGSHGPGVVRDPGDLEARQRRGPDGAPAGPRAAQQPKVAQRPDQAAQLQWCGRCGRTQALRDRRGIRTAHRRRASSRLRRWAIRPPTYRARRITSSWAPASSTHSAPNERLCS